MEMFYLLANEQSLEVEVFAKEKKKRKKECC